MSFRKTLPTYLNVYGREHYQEIKDFIKQVRTEIPRYDFSICASPEAYQLIKSFYQVYHMEANFQATYTNGDFITANQLFDYAPKFAEWFLNYGTFPRILIIDIMITRYGEDLNIFVRDFIDAIQNCLMGRGRMPSKNDICAILMQNTDIHVCYYRFKAEWTVLMSSCQKRLRTEHELTHGEYLHLLNRIYQCVKRHGEPEGSARIHADKEIGFDGRMRIRGDGFNIRHLVELGTTAPDLEHAEFYQTNWHYHPELTWCRVFNINSEGLFAACLQIKHSDTGATLTPYFFFPDLPLKTVSKVLGKKLDGLSATAIGNQLQRVLGDALLNEFCQSHQFVANRLFRLQPSFDQLIKLINHGHQPREYLLRTASDILEPLLLQMYDRECRFQSLLHQQTYGVDRVTIELERSRPLRPKEYIRDNPATIHQAASQLAYFTDVGVIGLSYEFNGDSLRQTVDSREHALFILPYELRDFQDALSSLLRHCSELNIDPLSVLEQLAKQSPEFAENAVKIKGLLHDCRMLDLTVQQDLCLIGDMLYAASEEEHYWQQTARASVCSDALQKKLTAEVETFFAKNYG